MSHLRELQDENRPVVDLAMVVRVKSRVGWVYYGSCFDHVPWSVRDEIGKCRAD